MEKEKIPSKKTERDEIPRKRSYKITETDDFDNEPEEDFLVSDYEEKKTDSSMNLEELHEFVIHQLIVSYNLYKTIKELYSKQEDLEKTLSTLQKIKNLPDEVRKAISEETRKKENKTYYNWIIITLQALTVIILILLALK